MTMPMTTFAPMMERMVLPGTASARKMGSISSEVDRNTAKSVPSVMTRPAHSVAATAEKPHWGTTPRKAPTMGPAAPACRIAAWVFSPVLCSSHSMAK